jgi:Uma2 family endonuclease
MSPEVLDWPYILPKLVEPGTRMSDDELIRFSEANRPYRFERNKEGEITMMSPTGGIGSLNEGFVYSSLFQWNRSGATGRAFPANIGFNLPDGSCLSPDAAWLALDRWNSLSRAQQVGFPPLCPDFLIEVRSHTDRRRPLEEKMRLWMDNGAKLAWLIDPIAGSVTIYQPGQPERMLERPEIVEGVDPVAGFVLHAAELWSAE